jgi:hypothetical protein
MNGIKAFNQLTIKEIILDHPGRPNVITKIVKSGRPGKKSKLGT